jgi:holo-[acyl-carrier protein] synthase
LVVAHGVDVIDVPRFSRLLETSGEKFTRRCFTQKELTAASEYNTAQRLSGWFAVKEAILKALGTGLTDGATFTDIQILHNDAGAPYVELSGTTKKLAAKLHIDTWLISISHTEQTAIGSVIGVRNS